MTPLHEKSTRERLWVGPSWDWPPGSRWEQWWLVQGRLVVERPNFLSDILYHRRIVSAAPSGGGPAVLPPVCPTQWWCGITRCGSYVQGAFFCKNERSGRGPPRFAKKGLLAQSINTAIDVPQWRDLFPKSYSNTHICFEIQTSMARIR